MRGNTEESKEGVLTPEEFYGNCVVFDAKMETKERLLEEIQSLYKKVEESTGNLFWYEFIVRQG